MRTLWRFGFAVLFLLWCWPSSGNFNAYEILGLKPEQFEGLNRTEAKALIDRAYRIMAFRHHPDAGGVKGKFNDVKLAAIALNETHGQGKAASSVHSNPSGKASAAPTRDGGNEDLSVHFLDESLRMYLNLQEEYHYGFNFYGYGQSGAVVEAALGLGFGAKDFHLDHPTTEPAFHRFIFEHLDDLLYPSDGNGVNLEGLNKLLAALEVSPHDDLRNAIVGWKKGNRKSAKTPGLPDNSCNAPLSKLAKKNTKRLK